MNRGNFGGLVAATMASMTAMAAEGGEGPDDESNVKGKNMIGQHSIHAVNSVNINVVEAGAGSPTLLFLHYRGGSSREWTPVIEDLSQTNRCVAIDFRGWGESCKEATDYRLETLAGDVVSMVDKLDLREFIIIGHSMGGKVAQLVAARKPAGLKRLILIAPAPPTALEVSEQQRQGMIAAYQTREGVLGIIRALTLSDAHREQIVEDVLRGSPGAKRAWPEKGMTEDISAEATQIAVPVRIVVGDADTVEPVASLRDAFGKVLPDTDFIVLPGVSHMAPLEATAQVVNAIRSAKVD